MSAKFAHDLKLKYPSTCSSWFIGQLDRLDRYLYNYEYIEAYKCVWLLSSPNCCATENGQWKVSQVIKACCLLYCGLQRLVWWDICWFTRLCLYKGNEIQLFKVYCLLLVWCLGIFSLFSYPRKFPYTLFLILSLYLKRWLI